MKNPSSGIYILYHSRLQKSSSSPIVAKLAMKDGIHPIYHPKVKVTCACGHSFTVGSTEKTLTVEVCSNCHPFYTGKQKLVDVAGRVDKFRQRLEQTKKHRAKPKTRSTAKKKKAPEKVIRIS